MKHDIGSELNQATETIEQHNLALEGVLVSIDFKIRKPHTPQVRFTGVWSVSLFNQVNQTHESTVTNKIWI